MGFLHHAMIVPLAGRLIVVDLTAPQCAYHLPRRWFDIDARAAPAWPRPPRTPASASSQPPAHVSRR